MVTCEVVGFRDGRAWAMPFAALEGVGIGSRAQISDAEPVVYPGDGWLGRVVDAMGEPVDGLGPLPEGAEGYGLRASPPSAHRRTRVGGKLDVGVRAINQFLSICRGQRMGIFAGSGVGKSMLMAMLARFARSEEHTSELQSLMRISYAVFCLKKNKIRHTTRTRR